MSRWPDAKRRRMRKFKLQGGMCWWCGQAMDLQPFRVTETGKQRNNEDYATFEHLTRKRDGGAGKPNNVVLAHARCNRLREKPHRPKPHFLPERLFDAAPQGPVRENVA